MIVSDGTDSLVVVGSKIAIYIIRIICNSIKLCLGA